MTQPNQSELDSQSTRNRVYKSELDMNMIEKIIADHNKAMRTDMASEIVGGTRSKAITDVITVKAIQAYTNAEIAKVLDRLESTAVYAEYDKAEDDVICGDVVPLDAIQAERAKLKEVK